MASVLALWGVWSIISLPLLSDLLLPGVVVPVKVPFIGIIYLFKNYSYDLGILDFI